MPQTRLIFPAALTIALTVVSGCALRPSQANIALRKDKQTLANRVSLLQRQHGADEASIAALQKSNGSLQTLAPAQLDELFTVHGIKLNRLTGGNKTDLSRPGDDGLKIYFVPTDEQDQPIKAVGDVTIEAFVDENQPVIQSWKFSRDQVKASWLGSGLLYDFVVNCPFVHPPARAKFNVRVTFTDALTGRTFSATKAITIKTG